VVHFFSHDKDQTASGQGQWDVLFRPMEIALPGHFVPIVGLRRQPGCAYREWVGEGRPLATGPKRLASVSASFLRDKHQTASRQGQRDAFLGTGQGPKQPSHLCTVPPGWEPV